MLWECKFDKQAVKDLQDIPQQRQKRIVQAITVLAKDPYLKNNNIKRLTGVLTGYYRLRIGNYRVLYLIDSNSQTIFITAVLPRNEKTYK
jgi:mRNA interferase RelE/StbE